MAKVGEDRSAFRPGEVSRGASTPEEEARADAVARGVAATEVISSPIPLQAAGQHLIPTDIWWNIGKPWVCGKTTYEPTISDCRLHEDTGHVLVKQGDRVRFPATSRKSISGQAPTHLVLWERAPNTDRLDAPERDYPAELREAMERWNKTCKPKDRFTAERIDEQVRKVTPKNRVEQEDLVARARAQRSAALRDTDAPSELRDPVERALNEGDLNV